MPETAAPIVLGARRLTIGDVVAVARDGVGVTVAAAVRERLAAARRVVELLASGPEPIYGLNTALGAKATMRLDEADLEAFQVRVVHGRSVSIGEPYPAEVVRAMLLARAAGLAVGGSGISPHVFDALLQLLSRGVHPIVPSAGSVGIADLTLCAALALPLLGLGEAEVGGERMPGGEALRHVGLDPVRLGVKDGIALCSSNAASIGHGALVVADAARVLDTALAAAALSLEGFGGNLSAFAARVAAARPGPGQERVAAQLRALCAGSRLERSGQARYLQDPISFRSLPAIHGVAVDAVDRSRGLIELELASAADNPLVLVDAGRLVSTGNFHTAALAVAFEALGLAIATTASATCQRVLRLLEPRRSGLTTGLTPHPDRAGLSPLGITLSATWAEMRALASPVCLDALSLADGVEDHSMPTPLVVAKTARLVELLARAVAIELLVAAQAIDLRAMPIEAPILQALHDAVRRTTAELDEDRALGAELQRLADQVASGRLAPG